MDVEEEETQPYSNLFKNAFEMRYSTGLPHRLRKKSTDKSQSISSGFFSSGYFEQEYESEIEDKNN